MHISRPKIIARLLGILCVTGLPFVNGCAVQERDYTEDGRVIVRYWEKWTGFEAEAMEAVVNDFNASQDRIRVEMLTVSGIDRKMILATAGGNPPDIAGLYGFNIHTYSEKNALTPIDSYLAKVDISRDDYIKAYWDLCSHRGFTWALPTTPASLALHWNKKLFREAGLDPNRPPRTIEELDQLAEQLTVVEIERNGETVRVRYPDLTEDEKADKPNEKGVKKFKLIQMGYSPSEPGWWNSMWGFWFGGRLWDGERTVTPDSPENIAAFSWFQGYPKKYGRKNMEVFGSSFGNFASPQNPFLAGKVAMVNQGVWLHNFIETYAPDMEWGAAPFPSVDPEKYPMVTIALGDVLAIPAGAKHPDEAFEFMAYVNQQGPMEKLCLGQKKFSPLIEYSEGFVKNHENPYIEVFIELSKSENAMLTPRIPIWNEFADEMNVAGNQIFTLIATPKEALEAVRLRVQSKLDRVMLKWDKVETKRYEEWRAQ